MTSWRLGSCVLLLLFLLGLCVGRTAHSDNLCPVSNVSYKNFYDGCGTYDWELVASTPYDGYDEGDYIVYGYCAGGYTMCNCTIVPQYDVYGSLNFFTQVNEDDSTTFWWDIDQWNSPTFSGCTSGSCQSTGVVIHTSGYIEFDVGYDTAYCDQ
ncbi:MAG TPA: hypothetical protein VKS20_05265 [Candidatus Acidoferrales bacterium]|nr:hypothetical protein [Candidatus Acidoferrales bacterium]